MNEAAPNAPWLEPMEGTGHDLSSLRCRAIFASHTPLAEEPTSTKVRGADERTRARAALQTAKRLFDRAAELGADRLVTDSGRACVALYLGETGEARRLQTAVEKRIGTRGPEAVRLALTANGALIAFADFLQKEPPPPPADAKAKVWAGKVTGQRVAFAAHPDLTRAIDLLAAYPAPAKAKLTPTTLACKGKNASAKLAAPPAFAGIVGQCPAGWTLDWTLPPGAAIVRSGTTVGVTGCVQGDARATRVQLAAAIDPPYAEADLRLRDHSAIPDAVSELDAWACGCDGVELQGVSDTGEVVYMAACPAFDVPLGVVFARGGKVTRVVVIGGAP